MTVDLSPKAQELLALQLARGQYESATEVVETALQVLVERDETIRAVREGLADLEAGRAYDAQEAFDEIRSKHPSLQQG